MEKLCPVFKEGKKCDLSCIYSNVSSLLNKRDELQGLIDEKKPDIIGLTEVWMKEQYSIKGYHPAFRHDRKEQKGGGVMLLVRDSYKVTECRELNETGFEEAIWCIIHLSRVAKLLVGVCYRSPSSSKINNEKLISMLRQTAAVNVGNVLIMGDFNYPHIHWEEGYADGPEDGDAANFYEVTQDLFLYQHVNFETRFREGFSPSRLDLVFSDKEYLVDGLKTSHPLGKSDHVVLTWRCIYDQEQATKGKEPSAPRKSNFRKGNMMTCVECLAKLIGQFLKTWMSRKLGIL